jgi:hypothetical protein
LLSSRGRSYFSIRIKKSFPFSSTWFLDQVHAQDPVLSFARFPGRQDFDLDLALLFVDSPAALCSVCEDSLILFSSVRFPRSLSAVPLDPFAGPILLCLGAGSLSRWIFLSSSVPCSGVDSRWSLQQSTTGLFLLPLELDFAPGYFLAGQHCAARSVLPALLGLGFFLLDLYFFASRVKTLAECARRVLELVPGRSAREQP